MYLPKIYQEFSEKFSDLMKDYQQLGSACRSSGPLESKCQELIKLGIAIGANSRGAVMSGARKSLAQGASQEEIVHAVILSLTTTGFPNMMAAIGWVNEVFEKGNSEK